MKGLQNSKTDYPLTLLSIQCLKSKGFLNRLWFKDLIVRFIMYVVDGFR